MIDESQNSLSDGLSWLALRYIGGEMTEAEAAVFEQRLGTDEAACEAVSTAVQVSLAAQAAFDSEASRSLPASNNKTQPVVITRVASHGPARSARWISLSVSALALLLVLAAANFRQPETASSDAELARELAVLWTEAGLAAELDETEMPTIVENNSAEPGEERLPPVDLVAGVPKWMLVALETQRGEAGDDDEILEN
jgi:hypothetical protein